MAGFLKLTWTELKLFLRDPFALVFALVFPLIMVLVLAAVFGDTPPTDEVDGELVFRGVSGDDYYVAASAGGVIAAIGLLTLPVHLAGYREQGILRRFRASSIPAWALFGSQLAVGLVIGTVGVLVMVGITTLIYDTQLPDDLSGVVIAFLLGMLCFTALGFLLAALLPTSRAAQGIGLILFFVLWMLSGTAPPRAVLPSGARRAGDFEPLTHVVIAIQDSWFGFGWNVEKLLIIAVVTIVAAVPAVWLFKWD